MYTFYICIKYKSILYQRWKVFVYKLIKSIFEYFFVYWVQVLNILNTFEYNSNTILDSDRSK